MAQNFPQDYASWSDTDFYNWYNAFNYWCSGTPLPPVILPWVNADVKKIYDLLITC